MGKYYSNVKLFHGIADLADFAPVFSFLNRGKILFKYETVSRNRGFGPFYSRFFFFEPLENIIQILNCFTESARFVAITGFMYRGKILL